MQGPQHGANKTGADGVQGPWRGANKAGADGVQGPWRGANKAGADGAHLGVASDYVEHLGNSVLTRQRVRAAAHAVYKSVQGRQRLMLHALVRDVGSRSCWVHEENMCASHRAAMHTYASM
eukprot:363595-Chlamydomonas_euryale.AAC.3